MPEVSVLEWEDFSQSLPDLHILQSSSWGRLKQDFGWEPVYVLSNPNKGSQIGAQILFRKTPLNHRIAYIPKGLPHGSEIIAGRADLWEDFLSEIDRICRDRNTIFLIFEPDDWNEDIPFPPRGFSLDTQTIQPPRTIVLNIADGERATLLRMKQKTRYNIRLAEKKGVDAQASGDVASFYRMMEQTGTRDGFGIHSLSYYQRAYEIFQPHQQCELFIAKYQDEPLAGIMVFKHGRRAWYFYGASIDRHRDLMPAYLVQWRAIGWAIEQGCAAYDLWGVPDESEEVLEANFTKRNDGLWGVYRFKRGFGGSIQRSAGPFIRIYQPAFYLLYKYIMKINHRMQGGY